MSQSMGAKMKTLPKVYNAYGEEIIRCELCRTLTYMSETKRCDRCWELETRIEMNLELAQKIIERIENERSRQTTT